MRILTLCILRHSARRAFAGTGWSQVLVPESEIRSVQCCTVQQLCAVRIYTGNLSLTCHCLGRARFSRQALRPALASSESPRCSLHVHVDWHASRPRTVSNASTIFQLMALQGLRACRSGMRTRHMCQRSSLTLLRAGSVTARFKRPTFLQNDRNRS